MAAFIIDTIHEYEINFICIKLLLFQMNVMEGKMVVLWNPSPLLRVAGEIYIWIVATA